MAHLFALDQNFPEPIVLALQRYLEDDVELVPLRHIDERLTTYDDWQVLQALHAHARPWDGLITTDHDMLSLPKELSVLCQTRLSLVIAVAAGHDPIKATGLVLAHIGSICGQTRHEAPQIWQLRAGAKQPEDPWDFIGRIAGRHGEAASAIYERERLTEQQLASDLLVQ